MSNPIEDKAFEEYLSGRSELSRRYRDLDATDVPAQLDDLVLEQARNAIQQGEGAGISVDPLARVREKRRRLTRWAIPTTLAACSLLVVSIVIRSGNQHEVAPQQVAADTPVAAPAPGAPAAKMEDKAATAQEQLVLIAPPRDAVTEFSELAPSPKEAAARAERGREQMKRMEGQGAAARTEQARGDLLSIAPPPQVQASNETAPAIVTVPFAPAPAEKQMQEVRVTAASAAVDEELQSRAQSQENDLSEVAVTSMRRAPAPRLSGPHDTVNATGRADASSEQKKSNQDTAPEEWLKRIRQLRSDGRNADADREWLEFRKQYPNYPVAETDLATGTARQ